MSEKKVWLITGAGRGLGVDIAKAALTAGHAVVATGRDASKVAAAVGEHDNLLALKLDVTRPQDADSAVDAAVAKFGRIDILVNNAGNFFAGFFEELTPEQVRNQIETLLFGPMNVTRAALPVMRKQRSGLVVAISSTAGIAGQLFCTAYSAAKFGIEGWMESLSPKIAAFGIRTMLVEPGFFRTELLSNDSTTFAQPAVDGYAERTRRSLPPGKVWMGNRVATPPNSPRPLSRSSGSRSRRPFVPAPTQSRRSRPRPTPCSPRPRRTASCPPPSHMMTHDHEWHPVHTCSVTVETVCVYARLASPAARFCALTVARRAYTSDCVGAISRLAHLRRRDPWIRNDLLEGTS